MKSRNHLWPVAVRFLAACAMLLTALVGVGSPIAAQGGTSDIAIVTTANGQGFYDACFVLVGYSQVGCDVNRDGQITFEDIPYGSYTLRQTESLGGGRYVNDTTIYVNGASDGDGWERFYVSVSGSGSGGGTSDIAVVATENGQFFLDACFVLVGYSQVGCDVNRDGKITFEDIPYGSYTLRQTQSLAGGRYINDTTIYVSGSADADGWERFYVTVSASTGGSTAPDPVDISLITRDPADGKLLTDVCYVLVGYSNEGCDENSDGQVTFAEIPPGTYTVRQTQTPAGYQTINDYEIIVEDVDGIALGFVVRQAPEQNAPGTRNVSVVFVDAQTNTRVPSDICVQFVGASNVGCDEDLRDGQIDFLDVPAGTWEADFSNLPTGWSIDPNGTQPGSIAPVTIDASAGKPSHQMVFVPVVVPAGAGNSGSQGASQSSAPAGETGSMSITALMCDGDCKYAIGAKFTVSTEAGEHIGMCTLEGDPNTPLTVAYDETCEVSIPKGTTVLVSIDPTSIPAGFAPEVNPISFIWPEMPPSYVGVSFRLVPQ